MPLKADYSYTEAVTGALPVLKRPMRSTAAVKLTWRPPCCKKCSHQELSDSLEMMNGIPRGSNYIYTTTLEPLIDLSST